MIDFSKFECDAHSYLGSDDKRSVYMDGKYYMVKLPNVKTDPNSLQTSVSNNVISEYLGCHILQTMGIDTQNTILGLWGSDLVVACEDFRDEGFELHEFSWYMQHIYPKSQIGRIATYEQLYGTFNQCSFLQPIRQEGIERYWDMIVGDALVGNFDRHKDNFGFLTNGATIKPAPVYDCGSCLYPALSEEKFDYILSNKEEIKSRIYDFPKVALSKSSDCHKEDKFSYIELLSTDFDSECTNALLRLYNRIDLGKIFKVVENTPCLSDERIRFYEAMLSYRKELILDYSYSKIIEAKAIEKPKKKSHIEYGE